MKKYLLLLLGVLLIAAGVYFLTKDEEFDALKSPELPQAAVVEEEVQPVFAWRFVEEGEGEYGAPNTRVFVSVDGIETDLGVTTGSCSEVAPEQLLENEVSGTLCWWAGGGTEFGVFKSASGYELRKGDQEEGTAESEGFRGNFKTVLEL